MNIHIMDTCGQERYNSLCERYYKKADGVLLIYDITNIASFNKIKNYYVEKIRDNCKVGIPILLLGNKTDLKDDREVDIGEAIDIANNGDYIYKETSCLRNENVADAFETIVEILNFDNKKNIKKRHPSKEDIKKKNLRHDSVELSARSNSYVSCITIDDDENETITLNKKKKKKYKCC